jgi:ABC-type dipeptide/oligopeptide/nickel transport system permease component
MGFSENQKAIITIIVGMAVAFLLMVLSPGIARPAEIKKGEPAPYDGLIFTKEELAQKIINIKIGLQNQIIQLEAEKDTYATSLNYYQQAVNYWSQLVQKLEKENLVLDKLYRQTVNDVNRYRWGLCLPFGIIKMPENIPIER